MSTKMRSTKRQKVVEGLFEPKHTPLNWVNHRKNLMILIRNNTVRDSSEDSPAEVIDLESSLINIRQKPLTWLQIWLILGCI